MSVVFIGDSVLDNFMYLADPENDLTAQCRGLGLRVKNHAVEGAKLSHLSEGKLPPAGKRSYPYNVAGNGKVRQLALLQSAGGFESANAGLLRANSKIHDLCVISIGGNDLKKDISSVYAGMDNFFNKLLTPQYRTQYDNVVKIAKQTSNKVALLTLYVPYMGNGGIYAMFTGMVKSIIERWNTFIYSIAAKHEIPVIDVSKCVECNVRKHYGTDDVYLSNESSMLIAKCIAEVQQNYHSTGCYYLPFGTSDVIYHEK